MACTVPMATSVEDCRRIVELTRSTGLKYMMMETVVYSREFLFVKELTDEGELGKIQFLQASHQQDMDAGRTTGRACRRCTTRRTASARAWRSRARTRSRSRASGRGRSGRSSSSTTARLRGRDGARQAARLRPHGADHPLALRHRAAVRESFDVYGTKKAYEWPLIEASARCSTPRSVRSPRSPSASRCPTTRISCPSRSGCSRPRASTTSTRTAPLVHPGRRPRRLPPAPRPRVPAGVGRGPRPLPERGPVGELDLRRHPGARIGDGGRRHPSAAGLHALAGAHRVRLGFSTLYWSGGVGEELLPWFERLASWGYEGVELPVVEASEAELERARTALDALGLARTAVGFATEETNPVSPDPAVRRAAGEHLARLVDRAASLGAELLGGPLHSAYAEFTGRGPTEDERGWCADALHAAAERAGGRRPAPRGRVPEPLRVLLRDDGGGGPRAGRARRPPGALHGVRHTPRAHRGGLGHGGDPRVRGHARPRAGVGEPPGRARRGPGAVGRDLRGAARCRLRRLARRRVVLAERPRVRRASPGSGATSRRTPRRSRARRCRSCGPGGPDRQSTIWSRSRIGSVRAPATSSTPSGASATSRGSWSVRPRKESSVSSSMRRTGTWNVR